MSWIAHFLVINSIFIDSNFQNFLEYITHTRATLVLDFEPLFYGQT